ncbi:MAG: hypothetical protein ACRD8W_30860 [Nitrososphaeraceae archaeon]
MSFLIFYLRFEFKLNNATIKIRKVRYCWQDLRDCKELAEGHVQCFVAAKRYHEETTIQEVGEYVHRAISLLVTKPSVSIS